MSVFQGALKLTLKRQGVGKIPFWLFQTHKHIAKLEIKFIVFPIVKEYNSCKWGSYVSPTF